MRILVPVCGVIGMVNALATTPVNPAVRADVVRFYHEEYAPTRDYESHHGWTGSVLGCDPGTVSDHLHQDVAKAVNYFRAMAGLPAEIALSPELNEKCQKAALMYSYNNALSHYPPSTWGCYSEGGVEAAAFSNISLGSNLPHYGPDAVLGQMEDEGANNKSVGHRRWILNTKAPDLMGHGSIPMSPVLGNSGQTNSSMALWVIGPSTSELPSDFQFIAWPPAGCVPYQFAFARWSFGLPKGGGYSPNFNNATVSISHDGTDVPLEIIHRTTGAADPTIVFEPAGFPLSSAPLSDQRYTVTIAGITGAPENSYTYTVEVIDPNSLTPIALEGGAEAYLGYPNYYAFTPNPAAQSYRARIASTSPGDWSEGAENGTSVIPSQPNSRPLTVSTLASSGSRSFQLLDENRSFEINRTIIPSEASELRFDQRFRWVGNGSALIVEILGESGTWTELWRRQGTLRASASENDWDSSWRTEKISLAAYAGQTVRLRFRYPYEGGYEWFPYPDESPSYFGAFIDEIEVAESLQIGEETIMELPGDASAFQFSPEGPGEYLVQLQAQVADQWFAFGPPTVLEAVIGTPPVQTIEVVSTGIDAVGTFYIDAQVSGFATVSVEASSDGGATWTTDDRFQQVNTTSISRRYIAPAEAGSHLFRLAAE